MNQIQKISGAEIPARDTSSENVKSRVAPVVVEDVSELFMFQCTCESIHYRHAGYIKTLVPFSKPNKEQKVESHDHSVLVCTQCKKCYIWMDAKMYDVTKLIDLEAWDKTEREMHKATGPGGQC